MRVLKHSGLTYFFKVGTYPDVCLLLKGISAQHTSISDFLAYIKNTGEIKHLSLKHSYNFPRKGRYTVETKLVSG